MAKKYQVTTLNEPDNDALARIGELLGKMACDRYKKLFPWAAIPEVEEFISWTESLGITWTQFAFHIPDEKIDDVLRGLAAKGPVGGWRVQDENDPTGSRLLTAAEIGRLTVQIEAQIAERRAPRRRKRRA